MPYAVDSAVRSGISPLEVTGQGLPDVVTFARRVVLLAVFVALQALGSDLQRPFMIVSKADYDSLRIRASRWPWSIMKAKAVRTVRAAILVTDTSLYRKTVLAHTLGSAAGLAYVLDPGRRSAYCATVEQVLRPLLHEIRTTKQRGYDSAGHGGSVGPAHAAFMTYLALDIMYDDLDPAARKGMEEDCDYIASHHFNSWLESKYAIEAMMELYHHGPSGEFRRRAEIYRTLLWDMTTDDGIYGTGPGYAHSRLYMEDRSQKKMFMDICEYQGLHMFYAEPRFQHLHEWIFGYSVTPFNRTFTFGDSPPTKFLQELSSAVLRADRFSPLASAYASWFLGSPSDGAFTGGLLQYLMCRGTLSRPAAPMSRVFNNGGAWLLGRPYDSTALAGVLWNASTRYGNHAHFDANSINIAGFGELLLRNSGYDGWQEPDSARWAWIHRDARSSNTLTIGGRNFLQVNGGGITEWLVGGAVEYACGRSGPALAGGEHARTLAFIQPQGQLPGYFLVVDEVSSDRPQESVDIFFHPSAAERAEVRSAEREVDVRIKNCFTSDSIRARFAFFGRPLKIDVREGYCGSVEECSRFMGIYLDVRHVTDDQGRGRFAAVIFPYRAGRAVPAIEWSPDAGPDAMIVRVAEGITDVLVVPSEGNAAGVRTVEAVASLAYWREEGGFVRTYFVRHGTRWLTTTGRRQGFESNAPVSLLMSGESGEISSPGAEVTFHATGIRTVVIDGASVGAEWRPPDAVRVVVPPGRHHIELRDPDS
jgi:hypothetical protein